MYITVNPGQAFHDIFPILLSVYLLVRMEKRIEHLFNGLNAAKSLALKSGQ